ncbi:MAG: hypothetical protein ACK4YD_04895 [Chitinophagia bacterium]|jgi:hypothetical protein
MENKIFETAVENRMEGFQMKPSEAVWQKVEKRIQKEKKRRALIWWWIMGIAMAGACIQFLQDAEKNEQTISAANRTNISENTSANIKDETSNGLPTSEGPNENQATNASPWNDAFKNKYHLKDKNDAMNVNNSKDIDKTNPASDEAQQNFSLETTKGFINKENINEHPIAVEKKGNDTIVILRGEDIGKPKPSPTLIATLDRQLNFNAHLAFHGTGDLSGTNLEFGTERKWGKRYGFYNNLGVTIHSGQEVSTVANAFPLQVNSTYNALQTVTFGLQTVPTIYRYSKRGDLKIGAGLVGRYQISSSSTYGASLIGAGNNQYSYRIYDTEPNSFSIGYRITADLLLYETKKNKLDFQIFFQNDNRGDVITGLGFSFQTKYKK